MSTPVRVVGFAAGLVAAFLLAWGVGNAAGPVGAEAPAGHGHDSGESPGESVDDHTVFVDLADRSLAPGPRTRLELTIRDGRGAPVTSYDVVHERPLHLIVLDTAGLTDFQHVHPRRTGPGTWSVELPLSPGTSYRMYADGSTAGHGFVATADFFTTGHGTAPGPVPAAGEHAHVAGLDVALTHRDGTASLDVTRHGRPVQLQPYLGALGHLVVIRVDDLAYLHVHPEEAASPTFAIADLAPGSYRYFFDFAVDDLVHTAAFTVEHGSTSSGITSGEEPSHDDEH